MTATPTPRQDGPRTTASAQLRLPVPVSAPETKPPDLADRWAEAKRELDSWRRLAWADEDGAE